LWLFAAVVSTLVILGFIVVAQSAPQHARSTLSLMKLMCAVPFLIAIAGILITKVWKNYSANRALTSIGNISGLVQGMASIPFAILGIACWLRPVLNARGMTLLVPYLLLVLAAGVVWMIRTNLWLGIGCVLVLLVAHAIALQQYQSLATDPVDYKGLSATMSAQHISTDLIFIYPGLWSTPFFFYLPADRYNFVASDYVRLSEQHPASRVWIIFREREQASPEMQLALRNRQQIVIVTASHAFGILYSARAR
jgi:hypothetical protein